jgi:hypothetical protein
MHGAFGGNGHGKVTQTAGTVIQQLVPPYIGAITRLTRFSYTAAGTAHTGTVMRPIGSTTFTAAAAASATVVNLTADPGTATNGIAANDYVAIRETDGVTRAYKVSSVSTLAVTLASGLVAGVAASTATSPSKLWFFGITTDTDPATGLAHPSFTLTASATVTEADSDGGVVASVAADQPLLFNSDNGTAAGTLVSTRWCYTKA